MTRMITIKTSRDAQEIFDKAIEYDSKRRFKESLKLREALFEFSPKEAKFIISLAKSYLNLERRDKAEKYYRNAVKLHPMLELASLHLFHFLWDNSRRDEAMTELKRFQSVSHSDDYVEIVREINEKYKN